MFENLTQGVHHRSYLMVKEKMYYFFYAHLKCRDFYGNHGISKLGTFRTSVRNRFSLAATNWIKIQFFAILSCPFDNYYCRQYPTKTGWQDRQTRRRGESWDETDRVGRKKIIIKYYVYRERQPRGNDKRVSGCGRKREINPISYHGSSRGAGSKWKFEVKRPAEKYVHGDIL